MVVVIIFKAKNAAANKKPKQKTPDRRPANIPPGKWIGPLASIRVQRHCLAQDFLYRKDMHHYWSRSTDPYGPSFCRGFQKLYAFRYQIAFLQNCFSYGNFTDFFENTRQFWFSPFLEMRPRISIRGHFRRSVRPWRYRKKQGKSIFSSK